MQKLKNFLGVLLALVFLTLAWALPQHSLTAVEAATVVGYQTVTILDGATAYTTTFATAGYQAGNFGEMILQIHNDISGTGQITVTPQFSNQPGGCNAVTNWAGATAATDYVMTGTLAYGIVDIDVVLVDDDATLLRLPVDGRCVRVSIETATTITPTLYAWMVNTQ
jgi:hypothetical protein